MKNKFIHLSLKHKKPLIIALVAFAGMLMLIQLLYPGDRLLPFARIDGVQVDGWKKADAVKKLNMLSTGMSLDIVVADTRDVYKTVKPGDFGLTIDNQQRVDAMNYPWYLRIVPTSILWASATQKVDEPTYRRSNEKLSEFVKKTFGTGCVVQPTNATLKQDGDDITVVSDKDGGKCKTDDITAKFTTALPTIIGTHNITVDVEPIKAAVNTAAAKKVRDVIVKGVGSGIKVDVLGKQQTIPKKDVLSWLVATPSGNTLTVSLDSAKSSAYLGADIAKQVAIAPGTTYVKTRDFTELSRKTGPNGRALDYDQTRASILAVVQGQQAQATASTVVVPAVVEYEYTYSKTKAGIAALMKNYDTENAGVFGASLIELNGSGVAQWQGDKVFTTASTYKLFVAYGTLRKVEAGQWHWGDANIASGRNLDTCFEDMIVKSDNACAEALLKKLGYTALTNDLRALGLQRSGFTGKTPETTANDLALFLVKLQRGELPINNADRAKLLSAMSRQIFRRGIPAGASGSVADKVGFLDGLLHDAAIVSSPKGTYILVIMSDGSTWDNLADLTRKIEALR